MSTAVTVLRRYRSVAVLLAVMGLVIALTSPVAPVEELVAPAPAGDGPAAGAGTEPEGAVAGGPGPGATTIAADRGAPGASTGDTAAGGPQATSPAPPATARHCDPATGRIAFPSLFAPPCVPAVAENGGATYQGVTAAALKVVIYRAQEDPAVNAMLRAAGAADTWEQVLATYRGWVQTFQHRYETYGRRIELQVIEASGPTDDDAAARSDAIRVATQMKPFMVWGGPSPFVDELARRGIVVISQLARPIGYFLDRAPFVYGSQMASTQAYLMLAEFMAKRLAGGNAVHAGDAGLRSQRRAFGLIYLDTPDGVYKPGVDSFEAELRARGIELADKVSYESDINRAQEQARVIISRLQDKGVTSVIFAGDPLAPIFLTQEATAQGWYPEWVIPGGNLLDTHFFGRTYDQTQWRNAFGLSQLWIRPPQAQTEAHHQYVWGTGGPPPAVSTYEILYQYAWITFTGLHLAGPDLDPVTFRDGLFSFPASGAGVVSQVQRSFGRQAGWPFDDYTAFDSVAEVWWDPDMSGSDEVGNAGKGMWRFVDGGRRYAPGQIPTGPSPLFDASRASSSLNELPESDRFPDYPPP